MEITYIYLLTFIYLCVCVCEYLLQLPSPFAFVSRVASRLSSYPAFVPEQHAAQVASQVASKLKFVTSCHTIPQTPLHLQHDPPPLLSFI